MSTYQQNTAQDSEVIAHWEAHARAQKVASEAIAAYIA